MSDDLVTRLRGWLDEDTPIGVIMNEAADRIAQLEAEVLTWQGHAKTAIWGDSEECKSLSAEVDRLVRSRNKWGQRYNKLLLKIRAGENGETDDPASWQLRMALDDANVKNDEAADRIEQLEAALRIAQRGLDPYASYEAQLDARVVVDGICAALGEERT